MHCIVSIVIDTFTTVTKKRVKRASVIFLIFFISKNCDESRNVKTNKQMNNSNDEHKIKK